MDGYFIARTWACVALGGYFLVLRDPQAGQRPIDLTLSEAIGLIAMGVLVLYQAKVVYQRWQLWPRQVQPRHVPLDNRMQRIGVDHLKTD